MGKNPPDLPIYKHQEDSPYVSNARGLMQQGASGLSKNADRINTMDARTQADISGRLGNIYNRANQDFGINYNQQMAKNLANQYGRMGTLNSTSGLYANDMMNRTQQRKLADLAYGQAQGYEKNVDRELQRRYNAMKMYGDLFNYGQIPQKYDDQNYKIDLTNVDRQYQNDFNRWRTEQSQQQAFIDAGMDVASLLPLVLSDRRAKKNIKKLTTINNINIYEYEYKKKYNQPKGKHIGVMAQEVEHIPNAVVNKDGIKYVNYAVVLPRLENNNG